MQTVLTKTDPAVINPATELRDIEDAKSDNGADTRFKKGNKHGKGRPKKQIETPMYDTGIEFPVSVPLTSEAKQKRLTELMAKLPDVLDEKSKLEKEIKSIVRACDKETASLRLRLGEALIDERECDAAALFIDNEMYNTPISYADDVRAQFTISQSKLDKAQDEFDRIPVPDMDLDPCDLLVHDPDAFRLRQYWIGRRSELSAITRIHEEIKIKMKGL